jgi:acyl-coenzyme A thioesterase PaaI-like protein
VRTSPVYFAGLLRLYSSGLLSEDNRQMSPGTIRRLINLWPPFLFSGIRIVRIAGDWKRLDAELRLRWWNRNALGTMFGGSLFALMDPFYALLMQHHLGRGYNIWTKSAMVEFLSPGRSVAQATFLLTGEIVEEIRAATQDGGKCEPQFLAVVSDPEGKVIARANLTFHIRRVRSA